MSDWNASIAGLVIVIAAMAVAIVVSYQVVEGAGTVLAQLGR